MWLVLVWAGVVVWLGGHSLTRFRFLAWPRDRQALDFGIEEKRVFQMSGMVIRPDFYGPSEGGGGSRREMLSGLELDPDRRCVLVCWGGVGSEKIVKIGKAIAKSSKRVNIIFMCGNNSALKGTLSAMDWGDVKVLVLGFTDKVPFYMQVTMAPFPPSTIHWDRTSACPARHSRTLTCGCGQMHSSKISGSWQRSAVVLCIFPTFPLACATSNSVILALHLAF
jgi:hypothetical protein